MWVKQRCITSHLWVLRPRSTIRLSPTIRSVATETQWSRSMKLRIVYEFLLCRTTETDSGSGPSAKAKRPVVGKAHTCKICMPHHSGGDNATKVWRWSTCRNSFCDIFLHDPFAHHFKHALRFQVLPKNTRKTNSLVSELSATLPPSSGMPYHKQSGKEIHLRHSADL